MKNIVLKSFHLLDGKENMSEQTGLSILIKEGKSTEASEYIDNFLNNQEVLHSFSCSNNVINSIINLE